MLLVMKMDPGLFRYSDENEIVGQIYENTNLFIDAFKHS